MTLVGTQAVAAGAAVIVTGTGAALRRPPGGETRRLIRSAAGLGAATLAWVLRDIWLPGVVL